MPRLYCRSARWGIWFCVMLLALAGALPAGRAEAREIRLGGSSHTEEQKNPLIVVLPTLELALPRNDGNGGWRHIRIDAYLTVSDPALGKELDGMKSSIVRHAVRETLPATGYDRLKEPYGGSEAAKRAIHIAAQRALGHPWDGAVDIRTFEAY